jgi:cytochrome c oxidase cbb3-type subunit III
MAAMPSDFWSGWIILLTVVSFIGLGWLVLSVYFLPSSKNHDGEEPIWDNNLTEGSSSPPFWWFWLILSMMVISVVYLMLYPGLGSFEGAFRWSQGGKFQNILLNMKENLQSLKQVSLRHHIVSLPLTPALWIQPFQYFQSTVLPAMVSMPWGRPIYSLI